MGYNYYSDYSLAIIASNKIRGEALNCDGPTVCEKVKVKAICGSYSTAASRGAAQAKWRERPLLAKEGTIPGI